MHTITEIFLRSKMFVIFYSLRHQATLSPQKTEVKGNAAMSKSKTEIYPRSTTEG